MVSDLKIRPGTNGLDHLEKSLVSVTLNAKLFLKFDVS